LVWYAWSQPHRTMGSHPAPSIIVQERKSKTWLSETRFWRAGIIVEKDN
jgi:hypothetical protein